VKQLRARVFVDAATDLFEEEPELAVFAAGSGEDRRPGSAPESLAARKESGGHRSRKLLRAAERLVAHPSKVRTLDLARRELLPARGALSEWKSVLHRSGYETSVQAGATIPNRTMATVTPTPAL
jgi:hypothetical protein